METSLTTPEAAKTGRTAKTAAYYASFIGLGLTSAAFGPTLPGLAAQTQSRIGEISFLFTCRSLGYLFGSLLGGRLYDRFKGHGVQALALLGIAGLVALIPTLPLLWLLAGVLVLLGFVEGTLDVGGNTLLVWVHGREVGPFMNGLHLCFGIGAFLSPILVAQILLAGGGIAGAYWVIALLLLPVAAWLARLPSPPINHAAVKNDGRRAHYGLVALVMLFFFLNVGAETSFGGWIFTYARAMNLASETTAAYLTSAFWGGLTAGRLLAIPIAARVQPRWILLTDILGLLASLSLVAFVPGSFAAVLAGAVGAGLFIASAFPTTLLLAGRVLPTNGRITGLFFVGGCAGGMFFPWLIGQMFEPIGPRTAIFTMLAATALSLTVFAAIMRQTSRRA